MNTTTMMKIAGLMAGLSTVTAASAGFWTTGGGSPLLEGISNTGVGSGQFGSADGQYFTWTVADGFTSIGGVSAGNGVGGQGKISNDGRYICGSTFNAAMGYHEMSRYDRMTGTWTGFGMIPGIGMELDNSVSSGWAVSGDGLSVAGLGRTSLGTADTHAFQWTEGVGPIDLGSATVGESARVNGLNGDGSVAGGWQDGAGRQGSVWVNGVQELIFDNSGSPALEVAEISDDGAYAVGLDIGGFFDAGIAYRYDIDNNLYQEIPNLEIGAESRMGAVAVNGDGSVVGGGTWGIGPATFGTGFIWVEGTGTMTVGEYLDSQGIDYDEAFHFAFVSSISENGRWIAGWGNFTGPGDTQSFIVDLGAGCLADIDGNEILDLADVQLFIMGFLANDPTADLTAPFGVWDLADVQAFVASFNAGCP